MGYGSQTYGSGTFGSGGAVAITGVAPSVVSREGGDVITLAGVFPIESTYEVRVDGVLAFSGISGQGSTLYPSGSGTELSFVLPQIPAKGISTIEVTKVLDGSQTSDTIDVLERAFYGVAFVSRAMFPPVFAVGPRRLELEPQE